MLLRTLFMRGVQRLMAHRDPAGALLAFERLAREARRVGRSGLHRDRGGHTWTLAARTVGLGMTPLPLAGAVLGHRRTVLATMVGLIAYALLPAPHGEAARMVFAWDIGAAALLLMMATLLARPVDDAAMARHAEAQQEGEWTVFAITLAGVVVSFAALTTVLSVAKDLPHGGERDLYVGVRGGDADVVVAGDAPGIRAALCARILRAARRVIRATWMAGWNFRVD